MELLALQKHLLRVLSFGGVLPFLSLLETGTHRSHFFYSTVYAMIIHLLLISFGILQFIWPPPLVLTKFMDKTSVFVLMTGYLHWKFILLTMAIHSVMNIDKLITFLNIVKRMESKICNTLVPLRVTFIIYLGVIARTISMFLYHSHTLVEMLLRFVDVIEGLLFDFYNFHVYFQVWTMQLSFRHVKQRLRMALIAGSYEQIVGTLQECDLLFKALQAFNDYYGLFMVSMCIIAFLRCSLTMYFVLISFHKPWFSYNLSLSLLFFAGWNSCIIFYVFHTLDVTSVEANEIVLCTRHLTDDEHIAESRTVKQINKFLLKNLHQKKKFSAYGFFDIDNSVIYMLLTSVITYLVILVQFKHLEMDLQRP